MNINFQEVWDLALEAHAVPADKRGIHLDLQRFEEKLDRLIFNKDQPKQSPFMIYSPSQLVDLDSVKERGDALAAWTCIKKLMFGFSFTGGCGLHLETRWCPGRPDQWEFDDEIHTGIEYVTFARRQYQLFAMRDLPFLVVKIAKHLGEEEQAERFAKDLPPDLNLKQWDDTLLTDEDRMLSRS